MIDELFNDIFQGGCLGCLLSLLLLPLFPIFVIFAIAKHSNI